jgi:hypothetical protein
MNTQMWVHNYTQNIHNYLSTRSHALEEESRTIEITAKIGSVNGL